MNRQSNSAWCHELFDRAVHVAWLRILAKLSGHRLNMERRLVSRIVLSWNQLERWLRQVEVLRLAS
jgi:hypothetical protein